MRVSTKISFLFLIFLNLSTIVHCIPRPNTTIEILQIEEAFQETFCTKCTQSQCDTNYKNAKNPNTNNFTLNTLREKNITTIFVAFGLVVADYKFPNRTLKDAQMEYFVMYPDTARPQGIIQYFHPTLFGRMDAPTRLESQIKAVAGLYASQGFIVAVPDYVGYSYQNYPHPYVTYPEVNVQSAVLVLNQIVDNITSFYQNISQLNLFSIGYSEGATYSLWMETCITTKACNDTVSPLNKLYQLKASVGLDGPYDLRQTTYDFLSLNVQKAGKNQFMIMHQYQTNFGKPGLLAMAFNSFAYYNYKQPVSLRRYLNSFFYLMNCTFPLKQKGCQVEGFTSRMPIDDAFRTTNASSLSIAKAIAISALGKKIGANQYLVPNIELAAIGHQNSMESLVTQQNRLDFAKLLNSSQAINNKASKPIFIATLEQDSIVSPANFYKYLQKYPANPNLKSQIVPNTNHTTCQKFDDVKITGEVDHNGAQLLMNLYALAYVEGQN